MNSKLFTSASPGRLETIDRGLSAFVPSPLPATASFSDRLWPLLADVKQRPGLLEGIGRSLSNPGLLLRPLQTREALALAQIHHRDSLPVLLSVMTASGKGPELQIIQWGNEATPEIVKLIAWSTDDALSERERVAGENMIRAYLDHWEKLKHPLDPTVIAAVRNALEKADPMKSIRTTYHQEFLKKVASSPTEDRR